MLTLGGIRISMLLGQRKGFQNWNKNENSSVNLQWEIYILYKDAI